MRCSTSLQGCCSGPCPAFGSGAASRSSCPPPTAVSFLLCAPGDISILRRHGTANPLAGQIAHTILRGDSQSGRLLRTFLDLGFNEDESGQQVFEGMHPHIGSVRNYINVRFSQPGRLAGTQHTEKQYPGPDSPLTL